MAIADQPLTLDAESHRLEEWYLLLGELSHCLWYTTELPEMLRGFCRILVQRAAYICAEVELDLGDKSEVYRFRADREAGKETKYLVLSLHHYGDVLAQLRVGADFDLSENSDAYNILRRFANELAQAIHSLSSTHERHDLQDNMEMLALSVQQSPFAVVITNADGELEYGNDSYCRISGYALSEVLARTCSGILVTLLMKKSCATSRRSRSVSIGKAMYSVTARMVLLIGSGRLSAPYAI